MPQVKLSEYDPVESSTQADPDCPNNCWTCKNKQDIPMIKGRQMVKCFGSLKPFRQICAAWSDGRELEYMDRYRKEGLNANGQ